MEGQMCEICKTEAVMEGYPVCLKCFHFAMQWGTPAQKQRMRYYLQKERMGKDPEYKAQVLAARNASVKKYREKNKEKFKEYSKRYVEKHWEKIKAYQREYYKEYRKEHEEQVKEAGKRYRETHKEQRNAYQRAYNKRRTAENRALKQRVAELEQQLNSMTRVDNAQLVR